MSALIPEIRHDYKETAQKAVKYSIAQREPILRGNEVAGNKA
jgi:hypothetical protein